MLGSNFCSLGTDQCLELNKEIASPSVTSAKNYDYEIMLLCTQYKLCMFLLY